MPFATITNLTHIRNSGEMAVGAPSSDPVEAAESDCRFQDETLLYDAIDSRSAKDRVGAAFLNRAKQYSPRT
jgi:hypothetical protein